MTELHEKKISELCWYETVPCDYGTAIDNYGKSKPTDGTECIMHGELKQWAIAVVKDLHKGATELYENEKVPERYKEWDDPYITLNEVAHFLIERFEITEDELKE